MRKRIYSEKHTAPEWSKLAQGENLLFCGVSKKQLSNPVNQNINEYECVVLTDKRLITLVQLKGTPTVTTMPLSHISAIQTTALRWNTLTILLLVLLLLMFIIPGVIFLYYMLQYSGPRVNVIADSLCTVIKFSPGNSALLTKFINHLDLCTSYKS
jgi:hypothetical protein